MRSPYSAVLDHGDDLVVDNSDNKIASQEPIRLVVPTELQHRPIAPPGDQPYRTREPCGLIDLLGVG